MYLLTKWEKCIEENVQLPAKHTRTYEAGGTVSEVRSVTSCISPTPCTAKGITPCTLTSNGPLTPCTLTGNGPLTPSTATGNGPLVRLQAMALYIGNGPLTPCTLTGNGPLTPCTLTGNGPLTPSTATGTGLLTPCRFTGNGPLTQCTITSTSHSSLQLRRHVSHQKHLSSLGKCILSVVPSQIENTVFAFDELRCKVKNSKSHSKAATASLAQYRVFSRDLLIKEYQETLAKNSLNREALTSKQLQHKINVLKKILLHEWKIQLQH